MNADRVVALVMAAGYSRRFGADDKRRARLPDGRPLLAATLARAALAFPRLHVVLREEDDPQALGLPTSIEVIRVSHAERGLGASLGEAITTLSGETALADTEAVAVLLGDMPDIRLETLQILRGRASRSGIVRPRYAGRPGHPVLFGRVFWPELEALEGDEGGKEVLSRYSSCCDIVSLEDPGVCRDMDGLNDLDS